MTTVAPQTQIAGGVLDVTAAQRGGKEITRLLGAFRINLEAEQIVTGTYTGDGAAGRNISVPFQPIHVVLFSDPPPDGIQPAMFVKNNRMAGARTWQSNTLGQSFVDPLISLTPTGFQVSGTANTATSTFYWTAWGAGHSVTLIQLDVVGNGERNNAALAVGQVRLNAGALNQIVVEQTGATNRQVYVFVFETDDTMPHAV